jgi:hypothetical protein
MMPSYCNVLPVESFLTAPTLPIASSTLPRRSVFSSSSAQHARNNTIEFSRSGTRGRFSYHSWRVDAASRRWNNSVLTSVSIAKQVVAIRLPPCRSAGSMCILPAIFQFRQSDPISSSYVIPSTLVTDEGEANEVSTSFLVLAVTYLFSIRAEAIYLFSFNATRVRGRNVSGTGLQRCTTHRPDLALLRSARSHHSVPDSIQSRTTLKVLALSQAFEKDIFSFHLTGRPKRSPNLTR